MYFNIFTLFLIILGLISVKSQKLNSPYRYSPVVRRIISTKNAPSAIGPYNQAVQVGDTLYVSGNIGLDPASGNLVPGGTGPQTNQGRN